MKYKIHISGYIEKSQQLLVSFSSDETAREAEDYGAFAFDVVPYGDLTPQEIAKQIAKTAPVMTADIKRQEEYKTDSEKENGLRDLVGQSFEYTDDELFAVVNDEPQEVEQI